MRLIDADALIEKIDGMIKNAQNMGSEFDLAVSYGFIGANGVIKDAPTIEPSDGMLTLKFDDSKMVADTDVVKLCSPNITWLYYGHPIEPSGEREQPEYCIAYGKGVCGYPIEDCCECPKHEYYKELEKESKPSGDLISREDAVKALEREIANATPINGDLDNADGHYRYALRLARNIVSDLPSASEPKRGEWILDEDDVRCSVCGHLALLRVAMGDVGIQEYSNFCPNCGAKMGGKE